MVPTRLETARDYLETSVRLRRDIDFLPGVAANLVGLAYIAAQQSRYGDARAIIEEAHSIATAHHADGVLRAVQEARNEILERP